MTSGDPGAAAHPAPRIAVIGAGLAGLSCALALAAAGCAVTAFDKGRGPGGRLSTRRVDGPDGPFRFDHGGQYLSVRDPGFRAVMDGLVAARTAARWEGRIVKLGADGAAEDSPAERFVGTPGVNAIVKALADALPDPVRWGVRVLPPEREGAGWRLRDEGGAALGRFDAVTIAAPAPQAAALLAAASDLAALAARARMAACWAAMAVFDRPVETGWDAAFVTPAATGGDMLGWVAREASKPGRPAAEAWVLHGSPAWSDAQVELTPEVAAARLLEAFRTATGVEGPVSHLAAHRWRYALPAEPLGVGSLWDGTVRIGACGDWCVAPRAEAAFVSGRDLAGRMLAELGLPLKPAAPVSRAS